MRPETGSVASAALPNTMNGVVAEALDQSLPFHNQVAGPDDATVAQLGDVTTVPFLAFAVALGGNGAPAGIGLRAG